MKRIWPLLFAALLAGCDFSSSLLTEQERSVVYSLSLSRGSIPILDGSGLSPGTELEVRVSSVSGAAEPGALRLALYAADESLAAELEYRNSAASTEESQPAAVRVAKLTGSLPSFRLPQELKPGLYYLASSFIGRSGAELQTERIPLFVAPEGFGLGTTSLYPPNPRPGSAILLLGVPELPGFAATTSLAEEEAGATTASAELLAAQTGLRPWFRWSYEGTVFAEGSLEDGLDRAVWRVPEKSGVYFLTLELYPAAPVGGSYTIPAPWRQKVAVITAKNAAGPASPYADSLRFHALLAFNGDLGDSGTRAQPKPPAVIGKPRLEAFQGGFGYRFGSEAGVLVESLGLPPDRREEAFSIALSLSLEKPGRLFALEREDRAPVLSLSAADEGLILQGEGGETLELLGPGGFGPGPHDLLLSFVPQQDGEKRSTALYLTVDGLRRLVTPSLPWLDRNFSIASLGGAGSATAIYDGFGLSLDAEAGFPTLLSYGLARRYGGDLLIAEGFERSVVAGGEVSGLASAGPSGLRLEAPGRIAFAQDLETATALQVLLDYQGDGVDVECRGEDGALLFTVASEAALIGPQRETLGALPRSPGRLEFALRQSGELLEILDAQGRTVASLEAVLASRIRLAIVAEEQPVLGRFLVRNAPELDREKSGSPSLAP